ncbi:MAG: peptide chain release factor N(5)-glutamine methyltransferase [Ruminococcaceae bacterium]|nr:peptide chain release factor N(5)-glutamine methyltransferase [Oscillospiraceae bacterium]
MVKKYGELYLWARKELLETEGERAAMVARELLACASGKTVERVMANRELYASEAVETRLAELVERAKRSEPLPYLIGQWDFHGMTLTVTPDVLIPRDDTEAVVELAVQTAKLSLPAAPRILDLCTGSGCIGLAVASEVADARVTLGDLSQAALQVAKINTQNLSMTGRVKTMQMDAMQPASPFLGQFDLIVSNPPYVTTDEMEELDSSVKDYEPAMALHGGEDGLDFYRAIVKNFRPALKKGGYLAFEFGMNQHEAVCQLLRESQFEIMELKKDLGGIIRAVLARDTREED